MEDLKNIIVTKIQKPVVVNSVKGHYFEMENRPTFGLSLCISGQIFYTVNGQKYVSNKTTAIIFPKGGNYILKGDKEGLFPVVNFDCEGLNIQNILALNLEHPDACLKDFERLQELFLHNKSHCKIYSVFYELLDKIFSTNEQQHNGLKAVVRFIAENISNPELSNTMLAKKICISEVYLRKLFATHYNTSPKQYILECRIKKAKQLLIDTPFSITAIATECGFQSLYHFCRIFKERTGFTPSQFARQNKPFQI